MRIPLFKPHFSDECRRRITTDLDTILAGGQLMLGSFKNKFEALFNTTVGVPHSVSLNSCTTALTICLRYFDVTGRDVLVPSGAFITSVSSIIFAGGTPTLVDMNPRTLSFDLDDLERKITPKTKGIVWVHLSGFISSEYERLLSLARRNNLFLIEDAAHALGSSIDGKRAGSLGDAGCFSFYPTKVITCGTGGMITTTHTALRDYAEKMRLFGREPGTDVVSGLGNDWFLDEIRACVGYHQLLELEFGLKRRKEIAAIYARTLGAHKHLRLIEIPNAASPSYYQYPIILERGIDREALMARLKEGYQIETKGIYRPCHQQPVFAKYDDGALLNTEDTLARSLCLPMHARMTEEEAEYIISCLTKELASTI